MLLLLRPVAPAGPRLMGRLGAGVARAQPVRRPTAVTCRAKAAGPRAPANNNGASSGAPDSGPGSEVAFTVHGRHLDVDAEIRAAVVSRCGWCASTQRVRPGS